MLRSGKPLNLPACLGTRVRVFVALSVMLVCQCFSRMLMLGGSAFRNREKFLKAIQQLLQLHITSKQFFNLGTKGLALIRSLLMGEYVVVVLHFV